MLVAVVSDHPFQKPAAKIGAANNRTARVREQGHSRPYATTTPSVPWVREMTTGRDSLVCSTQRLPHVTSSQLQQFAPIAGFTRRVSVRERVFWLSLSSGRNMRTWSKSVESSKISPPPSLVCRYPCTARLIIFYTEF